MSLYVLPLYLRLKLGGLSSIMYVILGCVNRIRNSSGPVHISQRCINTEKTAQQNDDSFDNFTGTIKKESLSLIPTFNLRLFVF